MHDRSGANDANRAAHRAAWGDPLSSMQLMRAGQAGPAWADDAAARVWVYAVRSQGLRAHSASLDLSVPADFALVSARPPADWSLASLSSDDLVLCIDRLRWQAQATLSGPLPDPGVVLSASQSRLARHLLEVLGQAQDQADGDEAAASWQLHLQDTIVAFLVSQCHVGQREAPGLPARDQRRLSRLMDYMKSRLGAPVSSEDLARAAGLSVRALHALCQRRFKTTPMELLRNLRLDAVQMRLATEPEAPVGDVALKLGFGHLGRFSAYYRARFGELPTETRARHLGLCAGPAAQRPPTGEPSAARTKVESHEE